MSNLQILSNSIRTFENLYSLNDLHLASGNDPKHRPSFFIRNEQTKLLISEIENERCENSHIGSNRSTKTIFALKTIRGGADIEKQGTWGCKEIVIAYAAWISPQFHLVVLRAFLNQLEQQPKQLSLPTPEKTFTIECTERELQLMSWLWFIALRGVETMKMIHPAMEKLGSRYSAAIYGQAFEYNHLIRDGHKLIQKLTAKFEYDYESNWRVVKHIKNYNPKGNNSHVI